MPSIFTDGSPEQKLAMRNSIQDRLLNNSNLDILNLYNRYFFNGELLKKFEEHGISLRVATFTLKTKDYDELPMEHEMEFQSQPSSPFGSPVRQKSKFIPEPTPLDFDPDSNEITIHLKNWYDVMEFERELVKAMMLLCHKGEESEFCDAAMKEFATDASKRDVYNILLSEFFSQNPVTDVVFIAGHNILHTFSLKDLGRLAQVNREFNRIAREEIINRITRNFDDPDYRELAYFYPDFKERLSKIKKWELSRADVNNLPSKARNYLSAKSFSLRDPASVLYQPVDERYTNYRILFFGAGVRGLNKNVMRELDINQMKIVQDMNRSIQWTIKHSVFLEFQNLIQWTIFDRHSPDGSVHFSKKLSLLVSFLADDEKKEYNNLTKLFGDSLLFRVLENVYICSAIIDLVGKPAENILPKIMVVWSKPVNVNLYLLPKSMVFEFISNIEIFNDLASFSTTGLGYFQENFPVEIANAVNIEPIGPIKFSHFTEEDVNFILANADKT